jgi:metallo-beta-lactamase family protein
MKIKFCGAAQTVTGSQHLIEIDQKKILLDCGMFQGKREEAYQMNRKFLFNPEEIDCVLLSHSHIDHSGNLPTLILKGFKKSIYSTPATRDLASILLQDSAHIQEKDVEFVNKKRTKKGEPLFNPLYTIDSAIESLRHFKSFPLQTKFNLDGFNENVSVTFIEAGHILGSAQILLEINDNGRKLKLGFTGDLGRYNLPILKDPEFLGDVDYLIIESTYGGREHKSAEFAEAELENAIKKAMVKNSKIIVPSFSVGRTQEIVYAITKLFEKGTIPRIPIFVDSPLSVKATEIFKLHPECFDRETLELIQNGLEIFGEENIHYISDVNDSKKLNTFQGPCIIISASGMCEAGRILHHLANNIENPNNTILIVGFMAEYTLGRKLVEMKDITGGTVKIFGEEFRVNAKINVLNSFSAHADKNELRKYVSLFDKNKMKKIFLVHGEPDQQKIFRDDLVNTGYKNIEIPSRGDEFEI